MSFDPDHFDWLVEQSRRENAAKRASHAQALWRNAQTSELRAHLRQLYGADLFRDLPRGRGPQGAGEAG